MAQKIKERISNPEKSAIIEKNKFSNVFFTIYFHKCIIYTYLQVKE